jgi:mannose-6-phosphate isomerase-like protein (cupin superfamily)
MFHLDDLLAERAASGRLYHEFLRRDSLSVGIYVLPAGGADPQRPHDQDEVYYVLAGRARFRIADREHTVGPGALLFVEAGVEHRFDWIEEELRLLVFFAPALTG